MADVSIRYLGNHVGDIVERAVRGEHVTITRVGKAVAELSPVRRAGLSTEVLAARWGRLPAVDPERLRSDVSVSGGVRLGVFGPHHLSEHAPSVLRSWYDAV